jgi:ankyrin repeat protein
MGGQFQILEQRLHTQQQASADETSVSPATPESVLSTQPTTGHAVEIDSIPIIGAELDGTPIHGLSQASTNDWEERKVTGSEHAPPMIASSADQSLVDHMAIVSIDKKEADVPPPYEPQPEPQPEPEIEEPPAPLQEFKTPIIVNRSTLKFRTPIATMGRGNASLAKALLSAIRGQKANIVEQLLNRGVEPDGTPDIEEYPVIVACGLSDASILKLLLEFGGNPDVESKKNKDTALAVSCDHRYNEHLELLLQFGADPNKFSGDAVVLFRTVNTDSTECTEALLKYGADPKLEVGILELAIFRQKIPMITTLLDWGAPVNEKRKEVYFPVMTVIRDNGKQKYEILKLLLARGGDPNVEGGEGWPLVQAAYDAKLLEMLLDAGADPANCPGLVEKAVWRNSLDSVKMLIGRGFSVQDGPPGYTPLCTSIRDNRKEIFNYLLHEAKADPNHFARKDWESHPLIWAVTHNEAYVKPLLDAGADVSLTPGILDHAAW